MNTDRYRRIDLLIWAFILVIFESIILYAARMPRFAAQPFTVSAAGAIVCIVMMRWGKWCVLHAALSGIVLCVFKGGTLSQYLIYILGNAFCLIALPLLNKTGREKVSKGRYLYLLYGILTLLLMQAGRALISMVLGTPAGQASGFFTTDSLSIVFTLVALFVAKHRDGVYEEQTAWLKRFHENQESQESQENQNKPNPNEERPVEE